MERGGGGEKKEGRNSSCILLVRLAGISRGIGGIKCELQMTSRLWRKGHWNCILSIKPRLGNEPFVLTAAVEPSDLSGLEGPLCEWRWMETARCEHAVAEGSTGWQNLQTARVETSFC
ncbi:unnamed protein product [Pleuronectes platessa]|uniref:Uncharacterized protein n=1 Tax=Pleuronectes platessa TaxID=8262 RepID=A0A9N7URE0_PLEPL|nr:unnamed protein product [Pleuronectes platessa]